jgi:hypothetical protein
VTERKNLDWRDSVLMHTQYKHRECAYLEWGWGEGYPRCGKTKQRVKGGDADGKCECGEWCVGG